MLISIEGLDGVGKTGVAKALAEKFDYPLIAKANRRLYGITKEQSDQIAGKIYNQYSTNMQALYYLIGYLSVLEDGKKQDYISDRSILSTYYFSCCEENQALFDFFANNYGFPDLTIILYASAEERIRRIINRDQFDSDLKKERVYKNGYTKYFDAIAKYNVPYLLVNTERINQEEVIDITSRLIKIWNKDLEARSYIQSIFNINNIEQLKNYSYQELLNILDNKSIKRRTLERGNNNA